MSLKYCGAFQSLNHEISTNKLKVVTSVFHSLHSIGSINTIYKPHPNTWKAVPIRQDKIDGQEIAD